MLTRWLKDTAPETLFFGALAGIVLGSVLVTLSRQSALLEDIYTLAHEQRRLWLAKAQRDMAAAANSTKESASDA